MAKRINIGDWVHGSSGKYEFIGYVEAKANGVCKIKFTQLFNILKGEPYQGKVSAINSKNIKVGELEQFNDTHVEDLKAMIDLALAMGDKREFSKLLKRIEEADQSWDGNKKLWKKVAN